MVVSMAAPAYVRTDRMDIVGNTGFSEMGSDPVAENTGISNIDYAHASGSSIKVLTTIKGNWIWDLGNHQIEINIPDYFNLVKPYRGE